MTRSRVSLHKSIHEFFRELTRVRRLLRVVVLDVRDVPNVAGAKRIATQFPLLRPFVVSLLWVLLWNSDGMVAQTIVSCRPDNRLLQ